MYGPRRPAFRGSQSLHGWVEAVTIASASEAVVGRGAELDAICKFLEPRVERPRALLLEGEAGIGKTTLLAVASEEARRRGWHVLSCGPAAAEAQLAFAALADAFGAVLDGDSMTLPEPQRTALFGAVGRVGREVDRLALDGRSQPPARACTAARSRWSLTTFNGLTSRRPVHSFALRRLTAEPVVDCPRREGESLSSAFEEALRAIGLSRLPVRHFARRDRANRPRAALRVVQPTRAPSDL
jgi:hypothetical protein